MRASAALLVALAATSLRAESASADPDAMSEDAGTPAGVRIVAPLVVPAAAAPEAPPLRTLSAPRIAPLAQAADAAAPSAGAATPAVLPPLDPRKVDRWLLQTSLYTKHFSPQPDHNNRQNLINIERQRGDGWVAGLGFFKNSFHQSTQYAYVGKQWWPFASMPNVHVKVTGGLVHGYKDEYKDEIPLNHWGIAPAILPSIGWSNRRFNTELVIFGTAGLLWTAGVFFD